MSSKQIHWFLLAALVSTPSAWAIADLRPEKVHVADAKKNQFYIRDGLFTGGDHAIDGVVVKDIRRGPNSGYERVVVHLEGTKNGDPAPIQRPPYYQVAVTPDEKRLVFTLWGNPKIDFDSKKVLAAFKKSPVMSSVTLFPRLDENTWTFVAELKPGFPVEVFELTNPVRIIIDIRTKKNAP